MEGLAAIVLGCFSDNPPKKRLKNFSMRTREPISRLVGREYRKMTPELMRRVEFEAPPSQINRKIPNDVETIPPMMILGTTRRGDRRKQLTAQNGIALIASKKPPITKRIASQKKLSKVTPRMRHHRIKAMATSIPPTKPCNIYPPRRVSSGLQDAVWVVISISQSYTTSSLPVGKALSGRMLSGISLLVSTLRRAIRKMVHEKTNARQISERTRR